MTKSILTQEVLNSQLNYDPETGIFTRRIATHNKRHKAGDECGFLDSGYCKIGLFKKVYYAHRLAWFYVYGEWPKECIDHINRDRSDNRISNLRECSKAQNMLNIAKQKNNTSGYKGVYWCVSRGKWEVKAQLNRKQYHLGYFKEISQAVLARSEFCKKNHGAFNYEINN